MKLHNRTIIPRPANRPHACAQAACAVLLAAAGCVVAATSSHDAVGRRERTWQDIESRIQYGYFTENAHVLNSLREQLDSGGSSGTADKLTSYYSALLAYRLSQLSTREDPVHANLKDRPVTTPDKGQVHELLGQCVDGLEPVLSAEKDFAEGLALQGACLGLAADLDFWRKPMSGMRSGSQLKRALQLAPTNPRVLLLQAGRSGGSRAIETLKKAIAGFQAEARQTGKVPSWGEAEAYVLLARIYLKKGQPLTARDALERSLLIAPDFAQARRLLLSITS